MLGEHAPELAVADACFHDDGSCSDFDDLIEVLGREKDAWRVGNSTE